MTQPPDPPPFCPVATSPEPSSSPPTAARATSTFADIRTRGLAALFARRSRIVLALLDLEAAVLRSPAELTRLEAASVAAHVSERLGVGDCRLGHLDAVAILGGRDALLSLQTPPRGLRALCALADRALDGREDEKGDESRFAASVASVLDAGYGERAVEDVVLIAALCGLECRMATGLGLHGGFGGVDRVSDALAEWSATS